MVKLFSTEHTYRHPWGHVTSAFWRKYPNPLATHVKQIDAYDRKLVTVTVPSTSLVARQAFASSIRRAESVVPKTEQRTLLITNRLVACESPIPSWMSSLGIPTACYVAETCVVDPITKEMVIKSRNITGSSMMAIEETCRYTQHRENKNWTHYHQSAKITAFLPVISSKLESFSLSSMHEKSRKGMEAIEILCDRIKTEGLDSITSLTDTFNAFVTRLHSQAAAAVGVSVNPMSNSTSASASAARATSR